MKEIDIDKYIDKWIAFKKSKNTQEAYKREIKFFFEYLSNQNISPFLCSANNADIYMEYLSNKYKPNSVRLKILACSSFYSMLSRYNIIGFNPFNGMILPKRKYKKATSHVMNKKEKNIIIKEFKKLSNTVGIEAHIINTRESAKRMIPVIYFMSEYGIRVGTIQTIKIENNYFTITDKGNIKKLIKLKNCNITRKMNLKNKPFIGDGYRKITIQKAISRVTNKLFELGLIRCPYTCNDFRHYFAAELYNRTKDVLLVKEALGHSSLHVTDIYLQRMETPNYRILRES